MTTDETLRAALHVLSKMQLDVLWVMQEGTMPAADAARLLDRLKQVWGEVGLLRDAAAERPDLYGRYAAPGHSANEPSDN